MTARHPVVRWRVSGSLQVGLGYPEFWFMCGGLLDSAEMRVSAGYQFAPELQLDETGNQE